MPLAQDKLNRAKENAPYMAPPAASFADSLRPLTVQQKLDIMQGSQAYKDAQANYVAPPPKKKKKHKGFLRKVGELPFKYVREVARPIVKRLPKGVRNNLPTIGAIAGSLLGGPAGGALGGAWGGAARGGKHYIDHSIGGGVLGGLGGLGMDYLGGLGSGMGGGLGGGILPSATGWEGAAMAGSPSGLLSGSGLFGSAGLMNSLIGGGGGAGTLLNTGLLATAIGSSIKAKRKKDPRENETLQDAVNRTKVGGQVDNSNYERPLNYRDGAQFPPKGYTGLDWNYFPTPQEQQEQLARVNEELARKSREETIRNREEERRPIPEYARGGYVKDYYKGRESGRSDKRLVKVRPKSYIVNATTVSLAGDGNSDNGAEVIKDWANSFQNGHFSREDQSGKVMRAYVSDGEINLMPEEVQAIGRGSMKKGVKTIKSMEKGLRKHKGVNKFLPPKSKPLDKYAGITR